MSVVVAGLVESADTECRAGCAGLGSGGRAPYGTVGWLRWSDGCGRRGNGTGSCWCTLSLLLVGLRIRAVRSLALPAAKNGANEVERPGIGGEGCIRSDGGEYCAAEPVVAKPAGWIIMISQPLFCKLR